MKKYWNLLFQFRHLISFHCLGGPSFSKRTLKTKDIPYFAILKPLAIILEVLLHGHLKEKNDLPAFNYLLEIARATEWLCFLCVFRHFRM